MSACACFARLSALVAGLGGVLSCGTSIRVMYEGDVRFEQCMALESTADTKPSLQRECWDGWLAYYTFGQTRDRIDYATGRARELGSASNFVDPTDAAKVASGASPDPTSAIAPPPSVIAKPEVTVAALAPAPPPDPCNVGCDLLRDNCVNQCKRGRGCENTCMARVGRCRAKCSAQPSPASNGTHAAAASTAAAQ
jgi:hypothetical protein